MSTTTTKRSTTRQRPRPNSVVAKFNQWLGIKDSVAALSDEQETIRVALLATIEARGDEDDKGNKWLDLPEPVSFTDHEGKVFQYSTLKAERAVSKPTVNPEKAEELLRKKGLWLTEEQERVLLQIQNQNRYVQLSVAIDTDGIDAALFSKLITPKQYEALLNEPRVTIRFKPAEA